MDKKLRELVFEALGSKKKGFWLYELIKEYQVPTLKNSIEIIKTIEGLPEEKNILKQNLLLRFMVLLPVADLLKIAVDETRLEVSRTTALQALAHTARNLRDFRLTDKTPMNPGMEKYWQEFRMATSESYYDYSIRQ